jgi:hypothetical protein
MAGIFEMCSIMRNAHGTLPEIFPFESPLAHLVLLRAQLLEHPSREDHNIQIIIIFFLFCKCEVCKGICERCSQKTLSYFRRDLTLQHAIVIQRQRDTSILETFNDVMRDGG